MALVEVDPSELPSNIQAKLSGQPSPAPKGIDYHQVARTAAEHYGIDPDLFINQIRQESGFNTNARSPVGATGIAQIMPATAKSWGVNPNDPVASLDAAAKNMAGYINTYTKQGHDPRTAHAMALAAYNAGPGAVQKYKGVPPYAETQNYVKRIMGGNVPNSAPHGFSGGANFAQSPLSTVPQGQPQALPDLPTPNLLPGQAVAPIPGALMNGSALPAPNRMSREANQFNQSLLSEASQSMPQIKLPTAPNVDAIRQASANRFAGLQQTIQGAPAQPQGVNLLDGLGNIAKDVSGGLGNAFNTVRGVVTNPGQALNDIGGVIGNEAQHTQSPLDLLGGLGGGAVQGVADILNGISSLPADIGNSYLGRKAYAPALQIPTGGLQDYLKNKGASAFVGQLLPFVAAEIATAGGATATAPSLLARLGKAAGTGAAFGATMDSHGAGLKGRAESAGNLAALGLGLGVAGEVPGLARRAINPDHLTQAQIDNVLAAGKSPHGFINGRESGRFDNRAPIQQTRPGVAGEMSDFIARPGVEATPAELQDLTRSFNRRSLGLSDDNIITPKTPMERESFQLYGPNGDPVLTGKRGLPTSYEKGLERFGLDATSEQPVDLLRGSALPEGRRPLIRPEQKTEELIPDLGEKPAPLAAEDVQPVLGEIMKPGTEVGDQPAQDFLERAGYSFKPVKDKSSGTKMMATVIGGRSGLVKLYPGESIGSLASRLGSKGISLADAVSRKMTRENSIERLYDDVTRMMGDTEGAHDPVTVQRFFDRVTSIEDYARRVEESTAQRDLLTEAQGVLSDIDNAVTPEEYTLALEKAYESPLMQNPDPFIQHMFEEKVARAERRFEPAPETPLRSSVDVATERANLLPDKESNNLLDFNTRKPSNDLLDFGRVDRSNDLIRDINRAPVGDNLLEFPGRKAEPEAIQVLGPNGKPIERSLSPTKTPGEGSGEVTPSPATAQPGAGGGEVFHQGQSAEAVTKATQELAQAVQQFGGQLMTIAEAQRFIKENNYPGADHFQNILEAGKNNQRVSVTHTPLDRGGKVTNSREISPFAFEKRPIKGKTEVGNLIKEFSPNGDGINADLGAVRDNLVQRIHDAGVNVAAGEQAIEGKPSRTQRKILNKLADKLPIEKRTHVYVHDFNFGDSARPTADGARRLDRITESSLTGKMAEETAQYNNQIAPAFDALNRIANMADAPPAMKRVINQMTSGKVSKNSLNELRNVLRNASKEVIEQLCKL